jgi:lipoprotein LpqH
MPDQFESAGRASPLPPAGWYPDPQGSRQRYWDGTRWTEHRMPAKPTRKRVPWWLVVILFLIAALLLFFFGFFNFGNAIFRGSPSAPAPAGPRAAAPGMSGASAAPAVPAPPGSSSHTAGSVRIIIDGQEKSVQGTLWCAQRPDGKFAFGINNIFGVVLTPGTPPNVDSVVFSQGPPPNPQNGIAGLGMEFNANGPEPGQASATKDGNSYTIKGTAADAASAYTTTRPFEIDATCPS